MESKILNIELIFTKISDYENFTNSIQDAS